jgi:hypothetical protein
MEDLFRKAKVETDAQRRALEAHIQGLIERALGRAVMKIGLLGLVGGIVSIVTTIWTVRGTVDEYRQALAGQERQIEDLVKLVAPVPSIRDQATRAQSTADEAKAMILGHITPDAIKVKR